MLSTIDETTIAQIKTAPSLPVFSEKVCEFLAGVSAKAIRVGRSYPAITSFGYWCRPAALMGYADEYRNDPLRIGRGLAFHIAPSNVPVNFAFSLAASLLAGNKNIVRVPSKEFEEVGILSSIFDEALAHFPDMTPYVNLIRYGRDGSETSLLSAYCDARIIWGGNETIATIRKDSIPPRAAEITFADRRSFSVFDAEGYLSESDKQRIAISFFNDTLLTDQNACTSPHLVVWLGRREAANRAQTLFWDSFAAEVFKRGYEVAPVYSVGKLAAFYQSAAHRNQTLEGGINNPAIMRIRLDELDASLFSDCYHSGFFYEYITDSLDNLLPILNHTSVQTASYIGQAVRDELASLVVKNGIAGVDRIVPIGHTMDFSLKWDGVDLIRSLSRIVSTI